MIRKKIFRSTLVGTVLGGIPCALITATEGISGLWEFLSGINPPPVVLTFLAILYTLYLAHSGLMLWLKKKGLNIPYWLHSVHSFLGEVGHALQGVLLAVAGGLFVSLPPVLIVQPVPLSIASVILGYSLSVGALVASCGMAATKDYVDNSLNL